MCICDNNNMQTRNSDKTAHSWVLHYNNVGTLYKIFKYLCLTLKLMSYDVIT